MIGSWRTISADVETIVENILISLEGRGQDKYQPKQDSQASRPFLIFERTPSELIKGEKSLPISMSKGAGLKSVDRLSLFVEDQDFDSIRWQKLAIFKATIALNFIEKLEVLALGFTKHWLLEFSPMAPPSPDI